MIKGSILSIIGKSYRAVTVTLVLSPLPPRVHSHYPSLSIYNKINLIHASQRKITKKLFWVFHGLHSLVNIPIRWGPQRGDNIHFGNHFIKSVLNKVWKVLLVNLWKIWKQDTKCCKTNVNLVIVLLWEKDGITGHT